MSSTWRQLIRYMGPKWLVKDRVNFPDGTSVETDGRPLWTVLLMFDAMTERLRLGLLARFPSYAPDDALALIGRDRRIVRGPSESRASYEVRLQRAIDDHRVQGGPWAMLEQLRGYCTPHAVRVSVVNEHGDRWTIERDGTRSRVKATAWDWDAATATALGLGEPVPWSRFWVLIYPTTGSPKQPWARSPVLGTGGELLGEVNKTIGSTATPDDVQAVRQIVREWKPAGSRCISILIVFDDMALDPSTTAPPLPDGQWATWGKYSGARKVPARSADAIYWSPEVS